MTEQLTTDLQMATMPQPPKVAPQDELLNNEIHTPPTDATANILEGDEDGFCSTHQKKRRKAMLRELPDGTWSCIPGKDECKMKVLPDKAVLQKVNAERGSQVVVCATHGKKRSIRNMIQVAEGVYVCGPGEQCQMKVLDMDGVLTPHQLQQAQQQQQQQQQQLQTIQVPSMPQPQGQQGQMYIVQQPQQPSMQGVPVLVSSQPNSNHTSPNASGSQGVGLITPGQIITPGQLLATAPTQPQPQPLGLSLSPPGSGSHTSLGLMSAQGAPMTLATPGAPQGPPMTLATPGAPHGAPMTLATPGAPQGAGGQPMFVLATPGQPQQQPLMYQR